MEFYHILKNNNCELNIINIKNGVDINSDDETYNLFKYKSKCSEDEYIKISQRAKDTIKYLRDNNLYKQKPYFGLMSPNINGENISNPKEMEVVEYIRSLRTENKNYTLARIIEKLNENYPPKNYGFKSLVSSKNS